MTRSGDRDDRTTRWMRWIARVLGSLVAAYWLLMGLAYGLGETQAWGAEDRIMAGLLTASVVGVALAWWREGPGGLVLVIVAAAHSTFAYFAAGHHRALAMLISGGPLLVIGLLFLGVWYRGRAVAGGG
jgi:hypothetical protein